MFGFGSEVPNSSITANIKSVPTPEPTQEVKASDSPFGCGFTPKKPKVTGFSGDSSGSGLMSNALAWYQEIQPVVSQKVQEMLDDPQGIFAVELANVATFARSLGPKVAILGDCMAQVLRAEVIAKQQIDDLENAIKVQEAIVRRELKFGQGIDGLPPVRGILSKATVADIDGEILLDSRVAHAQLALSEYRQNQWAALVDLKARLQYALRALDRMCSVIPGLQGVSRDLLRGEAL